MTRGGLWKGLGRQVGRLGVLTKRREMTVQKSNSSQSNDSLEKTPIDGKDRRQEEKEVTEDEMVGWHHRLDGPEFEPTLGDDEGQGSLVCCSPWGCKELDTA